MVVDSVKNVWIRRGKGSCELIKHVGFSSAWYTLRCQFGVYLSFL